MNRLLDIGTIPDIVTERVMSRCPVVQIVINIQCLFI